MRNLASRAAVLALVIGALGLSRGAGAQAVPPAAAAPAAPADIRQILEGTWTLEEWHVDGAVMKPPEMTGRWMVHDGAVMAIRHRDGPKSFESTAAWGSYTITPTERIYGYERSEDTSGPTAAEARMRVRVTRPAPMQAWTIRRQGSKLFLERPNSIRWEFDGDLFRLYAPNGSLLRKYRKLIPQP